MRTSAALLASEMVSALRELSPEHRLEALALAANETILDLARNRSEANEHLTAHKKRVTREVEGAIAQRFPQLSLLEQGRLWLAEFPQGRPRVILKSWGDDPLVLVWLAWRLEGGRTLYASDLYGCTREEAWGRLDREVMTPLGLAMGPFPDAETPRSPENPREKALTALKTHQAEERSPTFPKLPARAQEIVKAVAQLDAEGKSTRDIMAALGISRGAVSRMLAASKGR